VLDRIEKERRERGKRRTIVTEGTCCECLVDSNNVGVSDTRPLLNWLEGGLIQQTKIYFPWLVIKDVKRLGQ